MKNKVIIDGNNSLFRFYHVFGAFKTTTDLNSGTIYGFIQTIMNLSKRLSSRDISIVWDSNGSLKRKKIYSEIDLKSFDIINESDKVTLYKEGRDKEKGKLVLNDIETLKKELECFGITQYSLDGYEADDLAAFLVSNNSKDKIYLYSMDNDWKSLIDSKTFICSSSKKDIEIMSEKKFFEKYGFSPKKMHDYKCLFGDKSDRIPGIKRLNKEKTLDFIINEGIEKILKNKKIKNEYIFELIKKNPEVIRLIKFNDSIVSFDLPESLSPTSIGKINEKEIREIGKKYELKNLLCESAIQNFLKI